MLRFPSPPISSLPSPRPFGPCKRIFWKRVIQRGSTPPSFVVSTVGAVASACKANLSSAQIEKLLMKQADAEREVVSMNGMGFLPRTLVVSVGEKVMWKNTSEVTHDVVADPAKALYRVDVKLVSFGDAGSSPGQYTLTVG